MDGLHQPNWLVFVTSVTGQNSSLRVRLWRQLKSLGAASLRDGVYLLPALPDLRQVLVNLRDELISADSMAYLLQVIEEDSQIQAQWQTLFERHDSYQQWNEALNTFLSQMPGTETEARRSLRQLRKELEAIAAIDFFPDEQLDVARRQCNDTEKRVTRHFSPDEPVAANAAILPLALTDYQNRSWATRARPWIDRIASAWLIQRFIDPAARFIWLTDINACPEDGLGFDFDGATFSHVGERVTFEVLLASFNLESNLALHRLGELVHALDVGGSVVPEGIGLEAILGGARSRINDDDQLLKEIGGVLDSLYAHFQKQV